MKVTETVSKTYILTDREVRDLLRISDNETITDVRRIIPADPTSPDFDVLITTKGADR
jgi:hypothetical protein